MNLHAEINILSNSKFGTDRCAKSAYKRNILSNKKYTKCSIKNLEKNKNYRFRVSRVSSRDKL